MKDTIKTNALAEYAEGTRPSVERIVLKKIKFKINLVMDRNNEISLEQKKRFVRDLFDLIIANRYIVQDNELFAKALKDKMIEMTHDPNEKFRLDVRDQYFHLFGELMPRIVVCDIITGFT